MPMAKPTSGTTKVPVYYPKTPVPGKLQILWDVNHKAIYNRLSPYTDYNNTTFIPGFTKQPYQWVTPEDGNKGLPGLRRYETRAVPIGSGPRDVIRVSKFLGSGKGIGFLATQFLLQTGNAYNETRIYNPASPIIAAGMALSLGTMRPQRNFDTSAGLLGIASTLIGSSIPNAIFGAPKINPVSGTAFANNREALPTVNVATGGKGVLRAGTAERGKSHLDAAWQSPGKFKFSVGALAKSLFQNFIPQTQPGIVYRSDEGAYGLMVGNGFQSKKFMYIGVGGDEIHFQQQWIAGGVIMRKKGEKPPYPRYNMTGPDGKMLPFGFKGQSWGKNLSFGVGSSYRIGFTYGGTKVSWQVGIRYGDTIGVDVHPTFEASQLMIQYSTYVNPDNKYPTKRTKNEEVDDQNVKLKKVIAKLNRGVYTTTVNRSEARVISSGDWTTNSGYDRLFNTATKNLSPNNYPLGVMQDYKNSRVVDNSLSTGQRSLGLPTVGGGDFINRLVVLNGTLGLDSQSQLHGWDAYRSDQIAFFFYDIVNSRYIPFRAAIKGITESSNASWDELPFIGRADKVYSYGGFTRNLSLGFKIVISSLAELAPTWQRLNYLTTLVKPSNYTVSKFAGESNRFMVPPMVMLTVGDMYKEQPVLIQTCTTTIPDDATWETLNEDNMPGGWEYLANYMKAPNMLYGQLPREVDITLTMILLEKERAVAGGANFGHAPRDRNWKTIGQPNDLHKSLVVKVMDETEDGVVVIHPVSPPVTAATPKETVLKTITPRKEPRAEPRPIGIRRGSL